MPAVLLVNTGISAAFDDSMGRPKKWNSTTLVMAEKDVLGSLGGSGG